jgi:hypothetical protein
MTLDRQICRSVQRQATKHYISCHSKRYQNQLHIMLAKTQQATKAKQGSRIYTLLLTRGTHNTPRDRNHISLAANTKERDKEGMTHVKYRQPMSRTSLEPQEKEDGAINHHKTKEIRQIAAANLTFFPRRRDLSELRSPPCRRGHLHMPAPDPQVR